LCFHDQSFIVILPHLVLGRKIAREWRLAMGDCGIGDAAMFDD